MLVPDVIHTRAGLETGRPKLLFTPSDEDLELACASIAWASPSVCRRPCRVRLGGSVLRGLPRRSRCACASECPTHAATTAGQRRVAGAGRARTQGATRRWVLAGSARFARARSPSRRASRGVNGRRTNEIQAFVTAGTLAAGLARGRAKELIADVDIPAGYTLEIGGEAAERDDAMGKPGGLGRASCWS